MQERWEEREQIRAARLIREVTGDRSASGDQIVGTDPGVVQGLSGLKQAFLEHAGRSVARARQRAGLSREHVARAAGVSIGVVDALEVASPAALTMEQYVDLALACGSMPLDITLASATDVQAFVSEVPFEARSAPAFDAWLARRGVRQAVLAAGTPVRKSS